MDLETGKKELERLGIPFQSDEQARVILDKRAERAAKKPPIQPSKSAMPVPVELLWELRSLSNEFMKLQPVIKNLVRRANKANAELIQLLLSKEVE